MCVDDDIFSCANGAEDVLRASLPRDSSLFPNLLPLSYHRVHYCWGCVVISALPFLSIGSLKIDRLTIVLHVLKCLENYQLNEKRGREKGQEKRRGRGGPASEAGLL